MANNYQLLIAVQNRNWDDVQRLINDGADINYVPTDEEFRAHLQKHKTGLYPAIFQAAYAHDSEMIKNLVRMGANVNLIIINHGSPLTGILSGREWQSPKEQTIGTVKTLLGYGASLHAERNHGSPPLYQRVIEGANKELANIFLNEALLRGDVEVARSIIKRLKLLPNKAELEKYFNESPRALSPLIRKQIDECISQLRKEELISDDITKQITEAFETFKEPQLDLKNYPKALQKYIEFSGRNPSTTLPLDKCLVTLRWHLYNDIDVPLTNEELESSRNKSYLSNTSNSENPQDAKRIRREKYDIKFLEAFLEPDNRKNAMITMQLNPAVHECLLQITIHPDLPDKVKKQCLLLLQSYENRTGLELDVVDVGQRVIVETQRSTQNFVEQACEQIIDTINPTIEKLTNQVEQMSQQMSMMQNNMQVLTQENRELRTQLAQVLQLLTQNVVARQTGTQSSGTQFFPPRG